MARLNLETDMIIESVDSRTQYKLLENVGSGTFGQVWCASETSTGYLRAVKVMAGSNMVSLLPEIEQHQAALVAAGTAFVPQFYEASMGFCQHDRRSQFPMIVMEYIDGVTASQLSGGSQMPEKHARIILANTCRAISRLHEYDIIHRDIKGANILVSPEGEVKVCDFGITTCKSNESALRQKAGTASHMAPELCALGVGASKYDEKVDIWALGILAIDLAMGRLPGDGRRDALRMIYTSDHNVPDVLRSSGFSVDYQQFAMSCLERDPQRRPSASELKRLPCLHIPASGVRDFRDYVQNMREFARCMPSEGSDSDE